MIAIEGNIGSGKSTILAKLNKFGYNTVSESVNSWNKDKWLEDFYESPEEFGFPFQMQVLHSHLTNELDTKCLYFTERSAYTSHNCFGRLLYEDNLVSRRNFYLMNGFYESFNKLPKKIIYLQSDPKVCLERIHTRGRESESNMSIDYLDKLHNKHEKYLIDDAPDCEVIRINGNLPEKEVFEKVTQLIKSGLFIN